MVTRLAFVLAALTQLAGPLGAQSRRRADPLPALTIFTRSDHYPFMMAGVPGVMRFPGKARNVAGQQRWFDRIHRTPRDRLDQGIDWNAAVRYATANLRIGFEVANQAARPVWRGPRFFQR